MRVGDFGGAAGDTITADTSRHFRTAKYAKVARERRAVTLPDARIRHGITRLVNNFRESLIHER